MNQKKLTTKLKTLSLRISFFILFFNLILMISCNKNDNLLPFENKSNYLCYNAYRKTKLTPVIGHTYIFKKDGKVYHFEYYIKGNSDLRISDSKYFFKPRFWKVKGDSLLFDEFYYKVIFKEKDELLLTRKNNNTISLKQVKDTFNIEFFKRKHFTPDRSDMTKHSRER